MDHLPNVNNTPPDSQSWMQKLLNDSVESYNKDTEDSVRSIHFLVDAALRERYCELGYDLLHDAQQAYDKCKTILGYAEVYEENISDYLTYAHLILYEILGRENAETLINNPKGNLQNNLITLIAEVSELDKGIFEHFIKVREQLILQALENR